MSSILTLLLKYKIINEKQLQAKIAKEFKLKQAIKEANKKANLKEFDKWLDALGKKNGYTLY